MPDRIEWCLFLVATCSALSAIGCSPSAVSCTETATCPPAVHPDSGVDAPNDVDESDAGPSADLSIDAIEPTEDVSVDASIDAGRDAGGVEDVDASTDNDTRFDMAWPDVPVIDVGSEPDACDPGTSKSPVESACLISEKYGVFVSPQGSDRTGIGTRGAPYKTLAKALQSAKGDVMRVYACDEGTGYTDALNVDATLDGMSLFGGFDCGGWTYATTRRARVHPASGVALSVNALTVGLTVEDFEFDAADATTGESSIGAIVDSSANVVLRGVKIVAGNGGAGVNGADGAKGGDGPSFESDQNGFPAQCPYGAASQAGGSWLNPSGCGSQGGVGGTATRNGDGTNGTSGNPRTGVTPANVDNGGSKGSIGQDGDAGSVGNAGDSGTTSPLEGLFSAAGFTPGSGGGDGTVGRVGQGGGGGGASNAPPLTGCIGASGGAGGMGGCGGSPGKGGASAGASVALLSWMSPLTLDRCELLSSVGGAGGNGGNGGKGGAGKIGATGGAGSDAGAAPDAGAGPGKAGNGGPGGNGGNGGSGAGGNGGPSFALVYKGTLPTRLNGTALIHAAGGAKGTGGSIDNVKAPDGLAGEAAEDFAVP